MPLAVIQNADSPQLESTAAMLRAAGYDAVKYCGSALRDQLKQAGCDTVLAVEQMERMGYEPVDPSITAATPEDVDRCDLFAEIKVRNVPQILKRWPRLEGRICYLRVNGAQPEICPKGGDEVNLPCPVVTACLWYGTERYRHGRAGPLDQAQPVGADGPSTGHARAEASAAVSLQQLRDYAAEAHANRHRSDGLAYVCWPPYPRMAEYLGNDRPRHSATGHTPAYGVAHYMPAWGFGEVVNRVADLGVHLYGDRAPRGQIPHYTVKNITQTALALVHLKSVDCPGWALYEALLSGCPVVTARLLNSRMLAYPLLEHGVTCYEFGAPASLEYGRGPMEFDRCVEDVSAALAALRDRAANERVGQAGRARLLELMWSDRRDADALSFREFCRRNFK